MVDAARPTTRRSDPGRSALRWAGSSFLLTVVLSAVLILGWLHSGDSLDSLAVRGSTDRVARTQSVALASTPERSARLGVVGSPEFGRGTLETHPSDGPMPSIATAAGASGVAGGRGPFHGPDGHRGLGGDPTRRSAAAEAPAAAGAAEPGPAAPAEEDPDRPELEPAEAERIARIARQELITFIDAGVDLNLTQECALDSLLAAGMGDRRRPHQIWDLFDRLRTFRACLTAEQSSIYAVMFPEACK